MAYEVTSRRGRKYYLHSSVTAKGATRYVLRRTCGSGAVDSLPAGFEVRESLSGQMSVVRKKKQKIHAGELRRVEASLAEIDRLVAWKTEALPDRIRIYQPEPDPAALKHLVISPAELERLVKYRLVVELELVQPAARMFTLRWMLDRHIDGAAPVVDEGPLEELLSCHVPRLGRSDFFDRGAADVVTALDAPEARRHLARLTEMGLLVRSGKGRGTRYHPGPLFEELLSPGDMEGSAVPRVHGRYREALQRGGCGLCGQPVPKAAVQRHLQACAPDRPSPARAVHLFVEGAEAPEYWMHLAVPGKVALAELDDFLREAWLECCGHLSALTIDGERYERHADPYDDLPVSLMAHHTVKQALLPGARFEHEYDFGTPTFLAGQVLGEWRGRLPRAPGPVAILAANSPLEWPCAACRKNFATRICGCCSPEDEEQQLCDECGRRHDCGWEALLPLVNSPRSGVCGYGAG